jgi:fluoride exporter
MADAGPFTAAPKLGTMSVARARHLAVLAGGALGALARAGVEEALPARPGGWPWATFMVNIVGALLLGWGTTLLTEMAAPARYARFLVGTGFCGALTTFSTLQVETIRLAKSGHVGVAASYAAASLAAGMAAAVLATIVARRRRYG